MPPVEVQATQTDSARLSLVDAVSLIIGIVVATSIFRSPPLIFGHTGSPLIGLGLWLVGGVLSILGALIYAELATTYPRTGGEYNYLTRAYGGWLGFLFAWSQLAIIQTASIGALGYVFADYSASLFKMPASVTPWMAGGAVVVLTLFNMAGLRMGTLAQNLLTVVKLLGLVLIVIAGLVFGQGDMTASVENAPPWFDGLALILILYAYGGWNDAAFVAAEVRNGPKNIPRALLIGLGTIIVLYLLVNMAYLRGLGASGLAHSSRPAAETLALAFGPRGEQLMSLIVMASALGGMNGLIFTAARVHETVGQDYRLARWLAHARWNGAPVVSLVAQGLVTVGMVLTVGTAQGRDLLNSAVILLSLSPLDWDSYGGGFETLVAGSAPAFWLFFLLNAIGFFLLRVRDRDRHRPFRVPGFPLLPAVFVLVCGWMLYQSATYAAALIPVICFPLFLGLPIWLACQLFQRREAERLTAAGMDPSDGR